MRKWMGILLVSLLCVLPMEVHAAKGSIEIKVPESYKGGIFCAKVGSVKNGQFVLDESYAQSDVDINCLDTAAELSEAAEKLFLCVNEGKAVKMVENGRCRLPDLEEGVYLLWGTEQARQGMLPNLLFLPTWQEMTREMQYELVVVPKLVDKGTPHTGDAGLQVWGIVAGVSFLAVVIIVMGKEFRKKKRFLP